ncbi:MAG: recombinase family protein [Myxococcales bacterium]
MPTRTVAYLRVSTDKQADKGVSLEAQREKVEAYAKLYDLALVEVIVDAGQSAKSLDRPGLQKALGMLRAKQADALLVVKLDRLTRSVRDLGDLLERHFAPGKSDLLAVDMQIDTRTPGGRMMLNILASVSQWEREVIGERTSTAMQHKRSRGEFTGGTAPYGFRLGEDGEHLAPVEEEQATIIEARRLHASGLTLREVAAGLEERGSRARTGRPFAPMQIRRMLAT